MRFQNPNIQEIKIMGLDATVSFQVIEDEYIDIECDNPEVLIKEVNQCIIITSKDEDIVSSKDIKRNSVIVIGSNTGRIVINSNIIIGGISGVNIDAVIEEMPKAQLIIRVPFNWIRYLDLAIAGICQIDGISKGLSVTIANSAEVNISNIEKVRLGTSGYTRASLKNIKKLNIDTSGQSFIDIQEVEELDIDLSGQYEIEVRSDSLSDAKIDASGMGNIRIESQLIENLEADLSGMVQLNVLGKVLRHYIDASGMSHYRIKE